MRRILFVLEDYNELRVLETIAKKLGFDTLGVQNDLAVNEAILSFRPDVVVSSGAGQRVNGMKMATRLRRSATGPKVMLLFPRGQFPSPKELKTLPVDLVLESPAPPKAFLDGVSRLIGVEFQQLWGKYEKLEARARKEKEGSTFVRGGEAPSSLSPRERRYQEAAESEPLPDFQPLPREMVEDNIRFFQERDKKLDVERIEAERKAFVKALFKK